MGLNFDIQIGTSRAIQVQCLNPDDSIPTGQFLDSDVLRAVLWRGAADAPVLTMTGADCAWISSANAQFTIVLHAADTALLTRGVYYLEATATRGSDVAALLPAGTTVTLTDTPGADAVRPTYIDVRDIRRIASWIDDVQAPGNETGFLEQCADARDWLDENILRNYRGGNVTLLGLHGMALDAWFTGGTRRTSLRNPFILNLLKQGPATITPPNGGLIVTARCRDVQAYYALHRITEGMITKGTQYAALSARSLHKAHALLCAYTAELSVGGAIDYAGSLIANIPINFSSTNTLWA